MEHPHLRVEMDLQEYTVVVQTIEVVLEAVVQALQEMEAMQVQQLVGPEVVVLEVRVQMELFNLLEAVI
jgi:soluble P-type ATPase